MDPLVKDWIQVGAWLTAIVGGITAALLGIREARKSTAQRRSELAWRRANAARELLDQIHSHEYAKYAVIMMDWYGGRHPYEIRDGEYVEIAYSEIRDTLGKSPDDSMLPKEIYIYDCFDWFFYYVDRVEHYIRIGLIGFNDVGAPFAPYVDLLTRSDEPYQSFMKAHGYDLARAFFTRYERQRVGAPHDDTGKAA